MDVKAEELNDVFRRNLKRRREAMGLTQAQLASKIGAHAPYISDLENGRKAPVVGTLAKLAEALAIQPESLISVG